MHAIHRFQSCMCLPCVCVAALRNHLGFSVSISRARRPTVKIPSQCQNQSNLPFCTCSYSELDVDAAPCLFRNIITVSAAPDNNKNQTYDIILTSKFWKVILGTQRKCVAPQSRFTRITIFYGEADQHSMQPKQTENSHTELSVLLTTQFYQNLTHAPYAPVSWSWAQIQITRVSSYLWPPLGTTWCGHWHDLLHAHYR